MVDRLLCCLLLGGPLAAAAYGAPAPRPLNFENDIIPILTRFGCNTSGCHGKAEGQNGFKLTVFGFDPESDYRSIVMEGRGRRLFPGAPARSLLLLKASGGLPHGGGVRMPPSRREYETLQRWVAQGARFGEPDDPHVVSIVVTPNRSTMPIRRDQQLQVRAKWSDGRVEEVTSLATYQSNNEALVSVSESGQVTSGTAPGTAAVMASFVGHVDVFHVVIPRTGALPAGTEWPEANFIDSFISRQLKELRIAPAPRCDDATFLRRAYLDILGTLPTADESRAFLASDSPADTAPRRARLVNALLKRPEFADYWALKWADVLRVNRRVLGHKAARQYYDWIHESFRRNQPLDQFARELITAEGPLVERPAGHFYRVASKPNEMASTLSQALLGVRIECAQCHHHPWDRWGQNDYFGMEAMFAEVSFKKSSRGDAIVRRKPRATKHPRTGASVAPRPLGASPVLESSGRSRRESLADWLTGPDNPWFAQNLANRAWAHFLGRGLVEPVDDFRLTNPPSHPELLAEMAAEVRRTGYDFRQLVRVITASEAYQRATHVNSTNADDRQGCSRFPFKRLDAEVLLDAINQVTGTDEKFRGHPRGIRAIQLWDSQTPSYFLKLFGRPSRETACECERVAESSVGQILHVLNSPQLQAKLSHADGRVARLVEKIDDDGKLVDELFLMCFSRFPTTPERAALAAHMNRASNRQQAAQDITWSMINTLEFLFNH